MTERPLTERQTELLQLIADGYSPKQAGVKMGITTKTVHNHLSVIYRNLGVQSMIHAVITAYHNGHVNLGSRECV